MYGALYKYQQFCAKQFEMKVNYYVIELYTDFVDTWILSTDTVCEEISSSRSLERCFVT